MSRRAVFIHGAGGGGWEWNAWLSDFEAAGWLCQAPDLIPALGGLAATRFDDYVRQVVDATDNGTVLIGASMGGILALRAAEEVAPKAIVLVNSVGPEGNDRTWPDIVEWSKGALAESIEAMPDSEPTMIEYAHRHWRDESGRVLREISKGISIQPPTCPLLIIIGDEDTDVPPSVGESLARNFSGTLRHYHGMSHVGPLLGTRAREVASDVRTWLETHVR